MPKRPFDRRTNDSTLSGSSSGRSGLPLMSPGVINPGISLSEAEYASRSSEAEQTPARSSEKSLGKSSEEQFATPEGRENFKNDSVAQFKYGRKSEASTLHFDRSTNRLNRGNPDIGNVDLGTIDADTPSRTDDLPDPEVEY